MENTVQTKTLITHQVQNQFIGIEEFENKLKSQSELFLPLNEELDLLHQLSEFELGRFLLVNKGLNGYWTQYIHRAPKDNIHPLEKWLITRAPVVRATQERFNIFQTQLKKYLRSNITISSIPCGLMDDLLTIDYSEFQNVNLVGIDLDNESLHLAQQNAKNYHFDNTQFVQRSAWDLGSESRFDVITSNGLNIYVNEASAEIALYLEFYKALKPGGTLITSFLTPPPMIVDHSPWKNYSASDLLKQKAIFIDILQANWQAFQPEEEIKAKIESAGFKVSDVIYDTSCIFPTIVCKKSQS